MPKQTQAYIPEEIFHAIATLVPRLIYIAEEKSGVEPIELLTLWHTRHFGRSDAHGQAVLLRHDLTDMLTKKFRFSDPAVSKLLGELQDKGFILRTVLSTKQRHEIFGSDAGSKLVV